MSVDDPHINHNENRCMYTVEEVQSEPGLIDRPVQNQVSDVLFINREERMSR